MQSIYPPLGIRLALFALLLICPPLRAQIAPECAGTTVRADYDEDRQQAKLQNYFAAAFLMTPLAPPLPYAPGRASVGLEVGAIPPLSCQDRLVLGGTKTEDTNKLPANPRPRLVATLPDLGPVSSFFGLTFLPPIPTPLGSVLQAGAEGGVGWRTPTGLQLGARAHLNFARMRAEIATPFVDGDPAVDDLFYASSMGADLGAGYQLPFEGLRWLTPYVSLGIADVSSLFVIGDDFVIMENTLYPWWGATLAAGTQALLLDEHLEIGVEVSSALPIFTTVKAKVAFVW
ncbi:MAG: hypothetical protein ACO3JL_10855 [Myxococcota bacterium]